MKQTLLYQPHHFGAHTCRLRVEGFPDVSTGQAGDAVGILTGWSLDWVGHPQLEGRREHLQALMATVIPYARHVLSGVPRKMGGEEDPIVIAPLPEGGHHIQVRSSQSDTAPLDVHLDDAELADLVRVLDQCRLDPRVQLSLPVPPPQPLPARELRHRVPLGRRIAAPVGGLAALAIAAGASTLLPSPRPSSAPQGTATSTMAAPTTKANPEPAPGAASSSTAEARLKLLRRWLNARTPARAAGAAPQSWQLAVNPQGEVVAATPLAGTVAEGAGALGLPSVRVANVPAGDTLLVKGVLQSSGFWELSPWHGW